MVVVCVYMIRLKDRMEETLMAAFVDFYSVILVDEWTSLPQTHLRYIFLQKVLPLCLKEKSTLLHFSCSVPTGRREALWANKDLIVETQYLAFSEISKTPTITKQKEFRNLSLPVPTYSLESSALSLTMTDENIFRIGISIFKNKTNQHKTNSALYHVWMISHLVATDTGPTGEEYILF